MDIKKLGKRNGCMLFITAIIVGCATNSGWWGAAVFFLGLTFICVLEVAVMELAAALRKETK